MPDLRSSGYSDTGPERGGAFWDVQRMGSHDSNPRRDIYGERGGSPPPWIPLSYGGGRVGNLVDRFSGLVLGDGRNEGVHQVIKALEDAESTIKQQLEENNVLKNELLQKAQELEKYRLEVKSLRPEIPTNDQVDAYKISNSNSPAGHEAERRWIENHSPLNPQAMVLHQNGVVGREETHLESVTANQHTYGSNKVNGDLRKFPGVHSALGSAGPSQYSTPSSRSLSPSRHQKEGGDQDKRFISSGNCLVPVSNLNSSTLWKQELVVKVREHEEEIAQLRKHLADYSIKEAQIRNEKYVLEKRIAYMRMAFDQQQQDLVDAASKAISYRQDIIEENIRLTYALQAAHAERSTFVSSLVPILSEHGLQPSVVDAQSIVSNLKVLFTHMQERFIIAEEKLKESQYQITPLYADISNAGFPAQSPSHMVAQATVSNNNSLEIVPQPTYPHAQSPISSNFQAKHVWETVGDQKQQHGPSSVPSKNLDQDIPESTPSMRDYRTSQDASVQINQGETHTAHHSVESKNQSSFKDLLRSSQTDDSETIAHAGKEPSVHCASGNSPYTTTGQDEPNAYSYLPTVLEEPSSRNSFSEDDDPLPAIDGLRISGDAYPGRELHASGYSINGTTSCNFEWVRYLEDGSVKYIEGAKQPDYLVTADDVDAYLAIEVQPLDDRKRKGELVKVFANDQRKITCDPEMQEKIKRTLSSGHATYDVSLSTRYLDIWETAILTIKKEGYNIKCIGPRGVVTEKFQKNTTISIPYGHPTEFLIQEASGEYLLRTEESSVLRDTIVLTLRIFKVMAGEKRKGRRKGLFFM
ncbi:uncharacterized protein LOC121975963 isoform X2 [Zingiber officinale]|uniref:uncharacterized protein LOC121975963 isoform X2 n=1 Tax=Zingiber officinale TaxID=94328 RepID=UPI001C4B953E|nr:uncharacterized protein LOC121975963 isoform X2 [Zingiber officinale]